MRDNIKSYIPNDYNSVIIEQKIICLGPATKLANITKPHYSTLG